VAVFFYQVAYGDESGGYSISKYDRMIITYQTEFPAGLNAVADVGVTMRTHAATDTGCTQGYNTRCNISELRMIVVHFRSSYVPSF
jgi:hypothetical protein